MKIGLKDQNTKADFSTLENIITEATRKRSKKERNYRHWEQIAAGEQ